MLRNSIFRLICELCGFLVLASCSAPSSSVEEALQLAGPNRNQLEAVLRHFKDEPQKAEAARFLISNMPYVYSYSADREAFNRYYDCYKTYSKLGSRGLPKVDSIRNSGRLPSFDSASQKLDITNVDSTFLINWIEDTYRLKETLPWVKNIPEDKFVRYVLPYRVKDEELSQWRDSVADYCRPVLDSLINIGCESPLEAANALLNFWSGKGYKMSNLMPPGCSLGFRNITNRAGSCKEFAHGAVYLMRAAGIPAGVDIVTAQGERNSTHMWSFIIDENGATRYANLGDTVWNPASEFDIKTPKIYRKEFGVYNNHSILPNCRDVTDEYKPGKCFDLKFDSFKTENAPAYLLFPRYDAWLPVDVSVSDKYPHFKNVAGDVIACLGERKGNEIVPISSPFKIDGETGEVSFIEPAEKEGELIVFSKYPVDPTTGDLGHRLVGGVIEGSNSPLFTTRDTLYQITEAPKRKLNFVKLKEDLPAYRYYRYFGPDQGFCNISELSLFENFDDTAPLRGRAFGTEGSWLNDTTHTFRQVFDGNPDTSFDYIKPYGGWAAIDLGRPVKIGKLMYAPRHRDNFIHAGDEYEIYYFADRRWNLAARMKAEADSLTCRVPEATLYYVKDLTQGKDQRLFEYDFSAQEQHYIGDLIPDDLIQGDLIQGVPI